MKVHNKFIKAFGALLIAALLFGAMPAGEVKAATITVSPGESIQDAIDSAAPGDTIELAAGTYDLTSTIIVDEAVTITGPDSGVALVQGTLSTVIPAFEITSSDVTLTKLSISHNNIEPFASESELDRALVRIPISLGLTNVSISTNEIYFPEQPGSMSTWNGVGVTIGDNTTTGVTITGNEIYNIRNGIVVRTNNTASITDNVIYNTKGGIMNYTSSLDDAANRLVVNNSWGLVHNEWDIVWNSASMVPDYQQSVLALSVANNDAYVLDLRAIDAATRAVLTGNRSHVFVDSVSGTETLHPANGNMNVPYAKIQDGIDAVVDGGTIYVAPGTYGESVNVNKSLNLQGPGSVETFTDPLVVNDWYKDRYEPGVFEVDTFLGESVLKHGVLASDYQTDSWHNFQGMKFDITSTGPEQTWSIDLYVDPAWEENQANAGFWAYGEDVNGVESAYPIIAWRSGGTDPAGFYSFDYIETGEWIPLLIATPEDYGKWHNFSFTYTIGTGVEYFVDGISRLTFADPDTARIANVILNVYNFGEDYDVYWDNFAVWDAKVVGQTDINASDVALDGLIFSNPDQQYGMQIDDLAANVDITNNLFADIGSESLTANVKGIYLVHGSDNVTIENNLFERIDANASSVNAIFSGDSNTTDPAEGLVIQDNRFQNITSQTKGGYGILLNNGAGNPAAVIDGNRFSSISGGGWNHAVGMEGPTLNALVSDNTFYNLTSGSADNSAVFFEANPDGGTVDVSGNRFQHEGLGVAVHANDLPGGANGLAYTVDASPNWWGSIDGPVINQYYGDITYSPWCGDVGCTFLNPQDIGPGENVQAILDSAPSGMIFNLIPGEVYPGGLIINNPGLTINLNGATIGPGSPAFTVNANNTIINGPGTLNGFTGDPLTASTSHAVEVADGVTNFTLNTAEILGWADGIHFTGVINNTVIADNFIHDNTGDAIYFGAQPVDQTGVSFYVQGNLFKNNGGLGVNNAVGTEPIDATYNAWGDDAGPNGPDGDGVSANVTYDPFTHVELYMVSSTNDLVDEWPHQVFVDGTISYEVKANMVNLTGADFVLDYPEALVDITDLTLLTSNFQGIPTGTIVGGELELTDILSDDGDKITFAGETALENYGVITADEVLFSFTVVPTTHGTAVFDFDEETDEFSMSPSYGPSNNIYADELVGATLDVITRPTLSADGLEGPYVAGISQEINIETCNAETGGDWSESVAAPTEPDAIAWVRITDVTIAEIASLQFLWEGEWYDFTVQAGPAVQQVGDDVIARFGNYAFGVEVPNNWCDYDAFRVTFVEPGFHDITIELYDMMDTPQDDIGGDDILLTYLGPVTIEVLGDFEVTGTIAMQGRTVRSGVPLTLTDVNGEPIYGPVSTISTSELAYNVLFPAGVNGSIYEITTNQPRYLNVHGDLDKQFLVNGDYTIDALELKGGNAVWSDNLINIQDASKVGTNYSNPSFEPDADVNFDGRVSIQDLALVGGNYNLTSAEAYADWLVPEYNGSVSGIVTDDGVGNISGSVSGDYNLDITGTFTGDPGPVNGSAEFEGTVSGDFSGTVTGFVYERGTDPLYAIITPDDGAADTVRLVGAFVKSGINGHFKGEIITGPELDPVTDVTISGLDTVSVGDTIDLGVTTTPADRWVIWSVHANHTEYASIDQNGILTGLAESPGTIEIIVVVIDDSSFSSASHYVTVTP